MNTNEKRCLFEDDAAAQDWINDLRLQGLNMTSAAKALRASGFRFPENRFRALWRSLAGVKKKPGHRADKFGKAASREAVQLVEAFAEGVELADDLADLGKPAKPVFGGRIQTPDAFRETLDGNRFVFTCAQNNTKVHPGFWSALQVFCAKNGAQLGVSRITYNKRGWANHGGISKAMSEEDKELWYDDCILDYVIDEQVKVADGLVFCGELDILPTMQNPLNGLSNYTGRNSAIVPHTKMRMQSVATMKHDPAKLLYTTGACTLRNYIQRRTGQIADYHHVYGALYVTVDPDGTWFVRQLNADDLGMFFDVDTAYGKDFTAPMLEFGRPTINLGDIHIEKIDTIALLAALSMVNTLKPSHVFLHDLIDFEARNHHNKKDPLFLVDQHFNRDPSVEAGMTKAARFLAGLVTSYPDTTFVVIRSNHDIAFRRWLREGSGFIDPVNERYWHEANTVLLRFVEAGESHFDIYKWALLYAASKAKVDINKVVFVQEDESFVLNGIEYGMHGHLGPNGAKGNPQAFRQIGRRANTGHTHSAGIVDSVWTAGVLAKLDMGYNQGPSSWSHSNIITYPNAKRSIVTQRGPRWRENETQEAASSN